MSDTKDIANGHISVLEPEGFDISSYIEMILDSVSDVISISKEHGGIVYVTSSVRKETGWNNEEMSRWTALDLAHEDDVPVIIEAFQRLNDEKEVSFEWRSKTKSGEYGWVETLAKIAFNPHDNCEYRVSSSRNIQRRKELEIELKQTSEDLSSLNKMKDKFFSLIAHDLKNPMFSLITMTEFMLQQAPKLSQAKMAEFISQINDTAKNSYILLENLLEWAKTQSGSIEFKPEPVKLEKVMLECWKLVKSQAVAKNISYTMEIPADLLVQADYKMLCAILRNLITNAIKFTPSDGHITVSASKMKGIVLINVEDNGIGMSREQMQYLFTTDARKQLNGLPSMHGSGLGLILCKEFMDKHNGTIEVTSKLGQGSKFALTIPQPEQANME
jgi:two-component system sensor histidine kinase/response regulator